MPQGFQAFDASGKLVVDLTDRLGKFDRSGSIHVPPGSLANWWLDIPIPGITADTYVANAYVRRDDGLYGNQLASVTVYPGFLRVEQNSLGPGTGLGQTVFYQGYSF